MNIGFDAKRAYINRSGLGNYSRNLIRTLIDFYPENKYTAFTPLAESTSFNSYLNSHKNVTIIKPRETMLSALHPLWRSILIPRNFSKIDLDIYHGLSAELPVSFIGKKVKKVVTIHDLIFLRFPELYPKVDATIYNNKAKSACKKADVVVAISEQTKSDLIEFYKVPENKIKVEYQTCDPIFYSPFNDEDKKDIKEIYNLPSEYILFVGTIEERKNLLFLLQAIKNIEYFKKIPLVVVGKRKKHFDEVHAFVSQNNMSRQVIFLDNIPNHLLPAFYQLATLFVYPSIFEGFGIPIIEAAFSKVPVITSTNSCFEEAGGPDTLYINPQKVDELSDAIIRVFSDSELRNNMVEKTYQFVQQFKNDATAASMIKLYKSLL